MARTADTEPRARTGTRERLLEAAGQMFAAHGFDGVTAKQICERAGLSPAAVNYHFGGLEGLYEAVLVEARDRVVGREDRLLALLDGPLPAELKLRAIIALVVGAVLANERASWILRLISREVIGASRVGGPFLAETARSRVERARALVGELIGLPADHPQVALATVTVAAPLQFLLIADRGLVRTLHPALELSSENEAALVEHFHRFAMAGLDAVRAANGDPGRP